MKGGGGQAAATANNPASNGGSPAPAKPTVKVCIYTIGSAACSCSKIMVFSYLVQ